MKSWLPALALSLVASAALAQTCAPAKLTKVVTRQVGPEVKPGSFAAAPMTVYRQGERLMRSEEAEDPAQKLHLLIVAAEPDIWFVNRVDRTGRHVVDPGPDLNVHAPIVTGQGVPAAFSELEYGCEAAFARARAHQGGSREVGGKAADIWALVAGDRRLEILLSAKGEPAEVAYFQGDRPVLVIRYDSFEAALPDDPALFRKPDGVTWQEASGR